MRPTSRIIIVIFIALLFYACENPITFVWSLDVETDAAEYTDRGTVTVTLHNGSEETVYAEMCHDMPRLRLEKRVGNIWHTVTPGECTVATSFGGVARNASVTFSINLPELPDSVRGTKTLPGTFRIGLFIYQDREGARILPEPMRRSNTFLIKEAAEKRNPGPGHLKAHEKPVPVMHRKNASGTAMHE